MTVYIQLKSVTVFWQDIGLPKNPSELEKVLLGVWWDDEIEPWMKAAIKGDCNPHEKGVWFADPHDAALFKLRFDGQGPL